VFFDGERVARKDFPGNTVSYYFSDHLKTASVITDAVGSIKSESDYYPWGGELQFVNGDTNHYKFTGKERDSESSLDYFGARYYSNGLGRFITPDWSATPVPVPYADLYDPQSLNHYSYVRNLPTTKTDPDGHCCLQDLEALADFVEAGAAEGAEMIATATSATVGAAVSVTAATAGVVYQSVQTTRAVMGENEAYKQELQAQHQLNLSIIKRNQQQQQLGHANGVDEEKSQSDDAKDKARTNGGLVKPDKGPGSVSKDQRDSKRVWPKSENDKKLDQQKGLCAHCGQPIQPGQGVGHHKKRHADGGKTDDQNHAVVCKPCHINDLHK
ncbi:MAG TPA: RHS repeat-associated core domain-containing protein, partial [Candidatus Angelobacter sp.]|nr:RHS repeat-associated core domain-containing protein [Candidatus Angelobacter sp.]